MVSAIDANFVSPPIPPEYQDVHVIASVLKAYLRGLPEPLLTHQHYNAFMNVAEIANEQQRKAAILNIIHQLPDENYNNLKYLMKFLSKLSEKNQQNKMSTQNIAIVMSPNLLWPQNGNDQNYAQQVNCRLKRLSRLSLIHCSFNLLAERFHRRPWSTRWWKRSSATATFSLRAT